DLTTGENEEYGEGCNKSLVEPDLEEDIGSEKSFPRRRGDELRLRVFEEMYGEKEYVLPGLADESDPSCASFLFAACRLWRSDAEKLRFSFDDWADGLETSKHPDELVQKWTGLEWYGQDFFRDHVFRDKNGVEYVRTARENSPRHQVCLPVNTILVLKLLFFAKPGDAIDNGWSITKRMLEDYLFWCKGAAESLEKRVNVLSSMYAAFKASHCDGDKSLADLAALLEHQRARWEERQQEWLQDLRETPEQEAKVEEMGRTRAPKIPGVEEDDRHRGCRDVESNAGARDENNASEGRGLARGAKENFSGEQDATAKISSTSAPSTAKAKEVAALLWQKNYGTLQCFCDHLLETDWHAFRLEILQKKQPEGRESPFRLALLYCSCCFGISEKDRVPLTEASAKEQMLTKFLHKDQKAAAAFEYLEFLQFAVSWLRRFDGETELSRLQHKLEMEFDTMEALHEFWTGQAHGLSVFQQQLHFKDAHEEFRAKVCYRKIWIETAMEELGEFVA
ncbi:unnamed protein product, partial [Amoebophrya sp. A120]